MSKRKAASTTPATIPAATKKSRSKYLPEMCETIIELGKRGRSKTQMAAHLNIARSTFDNWLEQHEEFREAWELADTHSEAVWESIGQNGVGKGHHFGDRTWSLLMRNRWPLRWRESRELELSGAGGAMIQINAVARRRQPLGAHHGGTETDLHPDGKAGRGQRSPRW